MTSVAGNPLFAMKALCTVLPLVLILVAVFFVGIGSAVLVRRRPIALSSRWFLLSIVLTFTPGLVSSVALFIQRIKENAGNFTDITMMLFAVFDGIWFMPVSMLLILVCVVFFAMQMQGYTLFGVTDETLMDALRYGLRELGCSYEETLTKIKLPELNTGLDISLQSWMGTGQMKIKDRSQRVFLTELVEQMRIYFKKQNVPVKNVTAIFYVISGGFMVIMAVGAFFLRSKLNIF